MKEVLDDLEDVHGRRDTHRREAECAEEDGQCILAPGHASAHEAEGEGCREDERLGHNSITAALGSGGTHVPMHVPPVPMLMLMHDPCQRVVT